LNKTQDVVASKHKTEGWV